MNAAERNELVLDMAVRVLRQHAKTRLAAAPAVDPDRLDWAIETFLQFAPDRFERHARPTEGASA